MYRRLDIMIGQMAGKVALVTGASSGIGRAAAIAFSREGAKTVVSDLNNEGGNETVKLIREIGGEALYVHADVSRAEDVKALIAITLDRFGRLDFAFNNAGIEGQSAPAADQTEENWDGVLGVNLKGVWLCMKYEIPVMLANGCGSIVNCSSVAGLIGFPGITPYVASKHGVIGLTKTAALEYATTGLRINAVCPGVIQTPMIDRFTGGSAEGAQQMIEMEPMGHLGTPEEIAAAVIYLCSDASSFVTGIALPVDGGMIAR
jgi:NAD(P)-dependent dehydrogenase (short-subunit alcohol dehydrogenase family)